MTRSKASSISTRHYLWIYVGLIALATLSVVLAELPVATGISVALLIAFVKAFLVLGWFMHLAEETFAFKLVLFVAAMLLGTLVVLTTVDPSTRSPYPPAPSHNLQYQRLRPSGS